MLFMSRLSGPRICGGWIGFGPIRLGSGRTIAAKAWKSSAASGL